MAAKRCFVIIPSGTMQLAQDAKLGLLRLPSKIDAANVPGLTQIDFDQQVYQDILVPLIKEYNQSNAAGPITLIRSVDIPQAGSIPQQLVKELCCADITITDVTAFNPNVFLEYGMRLAISESWNILIAHKTAVLPFDIQSLRCIRYDPSYQGITKAKSDLRQSLDEFTTHGSVSESNEFHRLIEIYSGKTRERKLLEALQKGPALLIKVLSKGAGGGLASDILDLLEQAGEVLQENPSGQEKAIDHYKAMSQIPKLDWRTRYKIYKTLAQLHSAAGMTDIAASYTQEMEKLEEEQESQHAGQS